MSVYRKNNQQLVGIIHLWIYPILYLMPALGESASGLLLLDGFVIEIEGERSKTSGAGGRWAASPFPQPVHTFQLLRLAPPLNSLWTLQRLVGRMRGLLHATLDLVSLTAPVCTMSEIPPFHKSGKRVKRGGEGAGLYIPVSKTLQYKAKAQG